MEKIPAKNGWLWIRQGFALFRKQPAEMSTLVLSYLFLMLVLSMIPLAGQMLTLILMPVLSMAFMQACVQVERGQRVYPSLLLVGFRDPARNTLFRLGLLYLACAAVAVALSAAADGGVFWKAMLGGGATPQEMESNFSSMVGAMVLAALLYLPAAMAFWFAAPLIMWQRMPLGKALFFSFYAVRRAGAAFLFYLLSWLMISTIVPSMVALALTLLTGSQRAAMFVLMPIWIILTVVMYCSFYSTYTAVFGKPGTRAEDPAQGADRDPDTPA